MNILTEARKMAGLTQEQWAEVSGTSRPTVSAYENGRKSPTLSTLERLFAAASVELTARPSIRFHKISSKRGLSINVPNHLPQVEAKQAFTSTKLPIHINWTSPNRIFDLSKRNDRARVYEAVLQNGLPKDVLTFIDGKLLVDIWDDLVLPKFVRDAWQPLIDEALSK